MVKVIRPTQMKTIAKRTDPNADTGTRRWQRTAKAFLSQYPLCVMCEARGQVTAAEVVDHVRPHKGDSSLFWDANNWQSLCKRCHDSDKQRIERQGRGGEV